MNDITLASIRKNIFIARLLWLSLGLSAVGAAHAAYDPPLGIPAPPFGIEEQVSDFYQRPVPWNQETPGWYYIDQYHPNASNSNSYGTPASPRQTLPATISAGSVVEVHGRYNFAPIGYDVIQAEGSAAAPVFIISGRGTASGPGVVLRKWKVQSSYTIIENLEFTELGKVTIDYPSHHVALRNSELHHMSGKIGGGGNSASERIHHIVLYNNAVHSQYGWDAEPEEDYDNHGIKFGPWSEDIWILDNLGYHNGGSFIQIGDYTPHERARRFYVGRNTARINRQNPIEIKRAIDIIISENHIYNLRLVQTNVSGQAGIVYLYGPHNLWIINNHIHNANFGINGGSNSGSTQSDIYIIGNLIHDLTMPSSYEFRPNSGWSMAGMMLAGGFNRYVINNTIFNVMAGINTPSSRPIYMVNNIIANISEGQHIFLEPSLAANDATFMNNLFYQDNGNIRIRIGGVEVNTIDLLEANFSASNNMGADPRLDTPTWTPLSSSPAVDNGTATGAIQTVLQRFQNLYGIDISRDLYGTNRPQGSGWDIGAVELSDDVSNP